MTDVMTLRAIESADPDGWSHRQPTDADYSEFRMWAIRTYGREAWEAYNVGGWAESGLDWL